jgi:hypothetical protein
VLSLVVPLVKSPDQEAACIRLIDEWSFAEQAAEVNEFVPLELSADDIATGHPAWRQDPERLALFVEVTKQRNRICQRRIEREQALVRGLASALEFDMLDDPVQEIQSILEGFRSRALGSSLPGAKIELLGIIDQARVPEAKDLRRAYLRDMLPRWKRLRIAWDGVLESTVMPGHSYGEGPNLRRARQEWGDAALSVQLAHELWAEQIAALAGGPEGVAIRGAILSDVCPGLNAGWICTFESIRQRAECASDSETALRIVDNWHARCDQLTAIVWSEHRQQLTSVLKGEGARIVRDQERFDRVFRGLREEANVNRALMESLGCDFAGEPCLRAFDEIAEAVFREQVAIEEIKAAREARKKAAAPTSERPPG